MKQLRSILKDLQDSGQQASIVGHFTVQPCHLQGVTNVNDVRDQPETVPLSTDQNQNPNRYTTEHEAENESNRAAWYKRATAVALPSELLDVIEIWPNLPLPIRAGILAMVKAAAFSDGAQL